MIPQYIFFIGVASTFIVSKVLAKLFRIRTLAVFWFCVSIFSIMMLGAGYQYRKEITKSTDTYWSKDFTDFHSWVVATWSQYANVDPRVADPNSSFWTWIWAAYIAVSITYIITVLIHAFGGKRIYMGAAILGQFVISSIYFWPIADGIGFSALSILWMIFPLIALYALDVLDVDVPTVKTSKILQSSRYDCEAAEGDAGECVPSTNGEFSSEKECNAKCADRRKTLNAAAKKKRDDDLAKVAAKLPVDEAK